MSQEPPGGPGAEQPPPPPAAQPEPSAGGLPPPVHGAPGPYYGPPFRPSPGYPGPHPAYPGGGQPAHPGGYPVPPGYPVRPTVAPSPPGIPPSRIEPVPGTDFGVAYFTVPPTVSGQAIGSLVAGIAAILVSFVVGCFGVTGARQGWGPLVGGAFAVLAAAAAVGAIGLGWFSRRQVARAAGRLVGRGMAVAGLLCGGVGLGLTAVAMLVALLI